MIYCLKINEREFHIKQKKENFPLGIIREIGKNVCSSKPKPEIKLSLPYLCLIVQKA